VSSRPSRGAARLASILDALPDALLLVDVNGTVVNANAIALETFESPGTALVGRGLLDLLPTFDSKRIPGSMRSPREAAEDTRTKPTRMTARRTDGTEFPVEITSANLEDGRTPYAEPYQDYGDPQQPHYTGDELLMLVVRDLSGTVDTEAELARQQRQTEMILRAAAEGVVGVDTAGKIVLVNPSAAQILGHRATDLGGKELHPLVHHSRPDGSPLAYEETPLADTLRSGRKHRVRGQVLWRKDGKPVPVDLTTAPVRDGDQLVGAVMTFTDRTAYDANDARSAQLRALLDTSLRGPLAELRGELSGLAADPAGQLWPEANQILHHLSAGYARITTLIDNVLAFQRLDRGEDKLHRAEVGLDQVIAAAVDGAIELIGPGRAQYAVHAPPIEASIDAERMAQALAHLIADVAGVDSAGNAIAYTGDSTIVVAAAQRGDVIRLDVRGPRAGGDPVHLPLARGIVERHGGVLQTHEVPGQGSAYVLEVPVGTAGGRGPGGSGRRAGSGSSGTAAGTGGGSDDTGGQPRESDTTVMPVPSQPVRGTRGPDDASAGTSTGLSSTATGRAPHPRRPADDADGTIVAPWAVPAASEPEAPTGRRRALRRPEEEQPDAGGQSDAGAPAPPPTGRRARRARPETPEDGPAGRLELPAAQTPHALPPASPAPQVPAQAQPQEGTGRRARRAIETGPAPKQSAPAPQSEDPGPGPWPGRTGPHHDAPAPRAPWQDPSSDATPPTEGPAPRPAPWPNAAREAEEEGGAQGESGPRNVNPPGPGPQWPNAENPPRAVEGGPQGRSRRRNVNPQGEPDSPWPNTAANQPGETEGNGPQGGSGPRNVNPQGPGTSWPDAAANQSRPGEGSGPQARPAGPGAGSPPPWLAAADQARSPEGDVPAWPNAANRPGPAAGGNGPQGGASSWPHAGGPQPSAGGENPAWPNAAEQPSGPGSAAAASGWPGAGDQDEEPEQGRDEGHEQDEDPRRPGDDGDPAWSGPGEQGPEQPGPAVEEESPAAAFGVVAPWPDPSERQAQPQRNRPGVPLPPSAWPAAQDPSQQSHGRAISVRTLGQGMPFGQHGGDPQTQTQAVQAQAPLPAQVAAGGSGRRRRLSAPPSRPPAQPPNPGQGQSEEQDQGPGGEPQARQHPQAEPDSGQLPVRRPAPEPPRPRLPGDHETALLRPVPAEPPNVPHQASGGRAYAIGAPAAGADEGPEPLDGPNGAVDVTDVASDRLDEGLDEPRRLLVWPEPDVSTRQALTDRGYRPVIVRSREEVDAQVAEPPAALFVDPLTGPITRTALQSLRQAAAAADVPVLVTAGLGQATREAAYGADPAVLLKALAPRDSEQHPPRVLLVESHEAIAQAFSATLERRGMQVTHANSETEAMTKAAQVHPNLVVMDLMLIRRRRQGIVDWLRGNARLTHTPMVVYTSADIDPSELPRLASGETVLFLAERSTSTDVQSRIVDLLSKIGS
jgi:PAS domain S-box-containing protein